MSKTVWIINQYASTPEFGYAGRHYYLGEQLGKLGYNVYLIASASHHLLREQPAMRGIFKLEKLQFLSVVWVRLPKYSEVHSKKRALGWIEFVWRMQKLLGFIPDKPDVIVCSSPSLLSFLGAERLARKVNARLIFDMRDIWPLTLVKIGGYSARHPFIRLMQWVENKAYRDSDGIISNLKNASRHIENRGGCKDKFTWIPNGFSRNEVEPMTPLNIRASEKIPERKFIVGYAGTLGFANALETLLLAAERLSEIDHLHFLLIGDGKERKSLELLVLQKNLVNVTFIEPVPKAEVHALLQRFDVCYIGWRDDDLYQFGIGANKIPEYLYSGKPVLHAYSGECDPIIEAGAGLQVVAEDPEKLAAGILQLYNMSAEELAVMGDNGRRAALEQYEYSSLALQFRDVLFPEDK